MADRAAKSFDIREGDEWVFATNGGSIARRVMTVGARYVGYRCGVDRVCLLATFRRWARGASLEFATDWSGRDSKGYNTQAGQGSIRNLTPLYKPAPAQQSTEETVPWPTVTRTSGMGSDGGAAGRVWLRLGDGPEETEYVRADRDPESEFARQIIYALERHVAVLDARANALLAKHDYGAEFFEADANRLREAIAMLKARQS